MHPESPIHQLVAAWWAERRGLRLTARDISERRLALTVAMLEEQRYKIAAGVTWNPFADARCLWAAAALSRLENPSLRADPDLHARAAWIFDPPPALCGKDHAAGAD